MGSYEELFKNESFSSGETKKFEIPASNKTELSIQIVGDDNTTDLDLKVRGNSAPEAPYGDNSIDNKTNRNISNDYNQSHIFTFDVRSINNAELALVNNAGSSTVLTCYTSFINGK